MANANRLQQMIDVTRLQPSSFLNNVNLNNFNQYANQCKDYLLEVETYMKVVKVCGSLIVILGLCNVSNYALGTKISMGEVLGVDLMFPTSLTLLLIRYIALRRAENAYNMAKNTYNMLQNL